MDPRYPIGPFELPGHLTQEQVGECIAAIAETPEKLRATVGNLSEEQIDTPYRPGGWTIRQVVHHLPDSHLNSYTRFRLALTEQEPTIKPYHEDRWAELPDARTAPIEISLVLLEALHKRWMCLLRSLSPAQLARTFRHPELGVLTLEQNLAIYAWHGRHHTAQIASLRERMRW